ncbi:TetR/AcrR family transcriptional regulator [Aquibacillus salsiterrae]|uniref:TetR/AcrR family transcriptional regulator C-terminal domain-containing protein n=1 Tax=Aquibacillus salsiterrae TaxID=2950439 RepID=A0A9X4AFV3_9BACI|nr:TetR/AcrR family transcriptional regulator C-terminal domain-containing protein [Aquibacillus salsiterrae]MDC3418044.1 TetR/AcrR family transcriptional regulator C-terminal domain-containing protein [Aquibacillus salsiterrae]
MKDQRKQTDLRVVRTRYMLKNALIELLQEVDVKKITVNRLAQRATINRVTFYHHYHDISDMLEKLADEMIDEISEVLGEPAAAPESNHEQNLEMLEKFLCHVAENAKFYQTILGSRGIPIFKDRLVTFLTRWMVMRIDSKGSNSFIQKAEIQKDILLWYDSAAIIGTIEAWLRNGMPYTPAYLAKQFYLIHQRLMEV